MNFDNFENSHIFFLWPEYFIGYLYELWIPCQASTSVLCLHYLPVTVNCSTKDAYTSEITFLALHPWFKFIKFGPSELVKFFNRYYLEVLKKKNLQMGTPFFVTSLGNVNTAFRSKINDIFIKTKFKDFWDFIKPAGQIVNGHVWNESNWHYFLKNSAAKARVSSFLKSIFLMMKISQIFFIFLVFYEEL